LFTNGYYIVILFFLGIVKGGFFEEFWRIFVLTRFEKAFKTPGLVFALVVSSIVFGFGHAYQGLSGIISIGIIGLLYALVYLRKRNAVEAIAAHTTFNVIQTILGVILYYGK